MLQLSLRIIIPGLCLTACVTNPFGSKDPKPKPGLYRASYDLYKDFVQTADRELWLAQYMLNEPAFGQVLIEEAQTGTSMVILAEENSNKNLCQSSFHVTKEHYADYKALVSEGKSKDEIIATLCERKTEAALLATGKVRIEDYKDPNCEKCMLHGKAMIQDPGSEALVLISSGNVDPSSSGLKAMTQSRDFAVVRDDPAMAAVLRAMIEADLAKDASRAAEIAASQKTDLTIGPYDVPKILDLIRSAKKSVAIENQYITEPGLLDILKDLDSRGVAVTLILQDPCSRGTIYGGNTYKNFFAQKLSATRAYAWTGDMQENGRATTLHTKAVLVDDERGWIGSNNFSKGGLGRHREFGVFLQADEVVTLKTFMDSAIQRLIAEGKEFRSILFGKCKGGAAPSDD